MSKVTGVLIDVMAGRAIPFCLMNSDELQAYYDILNCTTFDIATRRIGSGVYDIYCDDEGLLQCHPIVSAVSEDGNPMLVGNLFVVKTNDEGETISLSTDELSEVLEHITTLCDETGRTWPALICEY